MSNDVNVRHSEKVEQSHGSILTNDRLHDEYVNQLFREAAARVKQHTGDSANMLDGFGISGMQENRPDTDLAKAFGSVLDNMRNVLTHQKPQPTEVLYEQR